MLRMTESNEMYLETLYVLQKKKGEVISADIGRKLGYTRPSVSRAVSSLKNEGYIIVKEHGVLDFTEKGRKIAEATYEKHCILTDFLESIGVSPETAEEDACRIEHIISEETFDKIKKKMRK